MLSSPFYIFLTFGLFYGAVALQKKVGSILLNPILLSIVGIIIVMLIKGDNYDTYREGGRYIEFWLKPAIVALGLPLYRHMKTIMHQALPIFFSQLVGSTVGIVSVVLIAKWLGASDDIIISLAPKSVTTPIAIEISQKLGGVAAVTSTVVVAVGIFGSIVGLKVLEMTGKYHLHAKGISIGTAAHGLGTARMFAIDAEMGTFSTIGLILNGIFTALLTPVVLQLLGIGV